MLASLLLLFAGVQSVSAQQQNNRVKANQLGFYPNSHKVAITPTIEATSFHIRDAESGQVLYQGELSFSRYYGFSNEYTKVADFSTFDRWQTDKHYVIAIDGGGESFPLRIRNGIYDTVLTLAARAFYFNRASQDLPEAYAGKWNRPAGTPDTSVIIHPSAASASRPAGSRISSPGGWYDAGDFNKYVVPISSSISNLLTAYESFPAYFSAKNLNIPESGNSIPDILDESLFALRWLFTMQDPGDGGVYNKLTFENFSATEMPHRVSGDRYVVQKGTAATLDFAAVMAQASRVLRPFLPEMADSALSAAVLAMQWADNNPNVRYDQNAMNNAYDPDIGTGGYGDGFFGDELFWASTELYITTNEDQYYQENGWNNPSVPNWPNVHSLGLLSLLNNRTELSSTGLADTTSMKNALLGLASNYVEGGQNSGYQSPFGINSNHFGWGGNGSAASMGMIMLFAYELSSDSSYYRAAVDIMDYLLGRNPVAYSYLTGVGTQSPMHIHHRQSEADGIVDPVPGWLAGGANPGNQDQDCGAAAYSSTLPALSYLDRYCSYSTNEITTYWNAPLVYLAAGLEHYTQDAEAPDIGSLHMLGPDKDAFFDAGDSLTLEWQYTGDSNLALFYKQFGDDDYTLIADNIPADQRIFDAFIIPNIPGDSLLFKIQEQDDPEVFSWSTIVNVTPARTITAFSAQPFFEDDGIEPGVRMRLSWETVITDRINLYYKLSSSEQLQPIRENYDASLQTYTRFTIPDALGDSIAFRLEDADVDSIFRETAPLPIGSTVSAEAEEIPDAFVLHQNYPNPFNPTTVISFELAEASEVRLEVLSLDGRVVSEIANKKHPAGTFTYEFNASHLASGLYLYAMKANGTIFVKKMALIK